MQCSVHKSQDAELCIVPITSSTISVRAIAAAMNARGWSLFSSPEPQRALDERMCWALSQSSVPKIWPKNLCAFEL
eukprot:SAG11_NODE_134_length_15338_cov_3.876435_8_plen_76_part_00